jgi:hypothetical protein
MAWKKFKKGCRSVPRSYINRGVRYRASLIFNANGARGAKETQAKDAREGENCGVAGMRDGAIVLVSFEPRRRLRRGEWAML